MKGYSITEDDRFRADIIERIMCDSDAAAFMLYQMGRGILLGAVLGTNSDPFGFPEGAELTDTSILFDGRLEMANPDDRTPEQIEREIEQTRRNTAATLAAIEDRLAPGRLVDDAWNYLRNSGQGQTFVSNYTTTVRDNPIPVALLAISLAWLAIASSRRIAGARNSGINSARKMTRS